MAYTIDDFLGFYDAIERAYVQLLGRKPEARNWVGWFWWMVIEGKDEAWIRATFMTEPEYLQTHPEGAAPVPPAPSPAPPAPPATQPAPAPPPAAGTPALSQGRIYPVTSASDGEFKPRQYSYYPCAWVNGNVAWVFAGHADLHPLFFAVDLVSGAVIPHGPLLDQFGYVGEGEGIYWDAAGWIYFIEGPRLRHVNVFTGQNEVVFDISATHPNCDLWQAHSSDDGTTHCATVRQKGGDGAWPYIGIVLVKNGIQQFFSAADVGPIDESQIDTTGRWLQIKIDPDDDNVFYNIATGYRDRLLKKDGALGHSDAGPGYFIGADRDHEPRALVRWNPDQPLTPENRILLAQSVDWSRGDVGHISVRGGRCIETDGTDINLVDTNGYGVMHITAHGMVVPAGTPEWQKYDYQCKANLDPTGRLACYMTNNGRDRQDVYLVAVAP